MVGPGQLLKIHHNVRLRHRTLQESERHNVHGLPRPGTAGAAAAAAAASGHRGPTSQQRDHAVLSYTTVWYWHCR